MFIKITFYAYYNNLAQSLFFLMWFNISVLSVGGPSRFATTRMRSMGTYWGVGLS